MQASNARLDPSRLTGDLMFAAASDVYDHEHGHAVQFYESDDFLVSLVAEFAAEGLSGGQPVVVVAARGHADGLTDALHACGVDVDARVRDGQLIFADARETLAAFMEDGVPNADRFHAIAGRILERAAMQAQGRGVRAYGEMVDLLWRDGNEAAAIRLEELWNELATRYRFTLLCAYHMGGFRLTSQSALFERICRTHTHVRPTEHFIERDDAARLSEITFLQHRTQALETELRHRTGLEAELRDALAAADRARITAEQANRAKGQFLAVMSHELRTPLNAIGGYAELLDMGIHGPVSDEQRDALDRIQRSQRHLLGLINQVLNYTKVETGSLRYDFADVSLDDVLHLVETIVLPQIKAKGIRYLPAACGAVVYADREKLQQIVLNLLGNAAKFTDEGGEIAVACHADDSMAYVRIRDTGLGIPEDKLSVIFEPFVQVDANTPRGREGIGLGLAISRELARAMGGDITVVSTAGRGSTFTLAVPRSNR